MTTIGYVKNRFNLDLNKNKRIVEIPNTDRETLAKLFWELEYTKGAEIGVEAGLYSEVLCQKNNNLHLYCIDAWRAYDGYRDHVSQEKVDQIYESAKKRLEPFNCTFIRRFSMDSLHFIEDGSLDFVYIDANHEFQHVVNDICGWQKKVRRGGIVAGHDYIKKKGRAQMHVPMALHGFAESYNIWPLYILGSKERAEGERRDRSRSWFYVKT